jgi:hypothetical protein
MGNSAKIFGHPASNISETHGKPFMTIFQCRALLLSAGIRRFLRDKRA